MPITTIRCEFCGTVVMSGFLRDHMQYVHDGDIVRTQVIAKTSKRTISTANLTVVRPKSKPNIKGKAELKAATPTEKSKPEQQASSKLEHKAKQTPPNPKLDAGKTQIAKRPERKFSKLICILCGESIAKGYMLDHKEKFHGEKKFTQSPLQSHSPNRWVHVFQGGLPGLGKRNR